MRDEMEYLDAGGWTMAEAQAWMKKQEQKITLASTRPLKTDNEFHHIPVSDGHTGHKIQKAMISESLGIKALVCADCKVVDTYLFSKEKVYSLEYLEKMLIFKQKKLSSTTNPQHLGNYIKTIEHLKKAIKKRRSN